MCQTKSQMLPSREDLLVLLKVKCLFNIKSNEREELYWNKGQLLSPGGDTLVIFISLNIRGKETIDGV